MHANGAPVIRLRRPADRRSRIQRWNDTIAAAVGCRWSTPTGWTRCRKTNRTVHSPMPCGRLSNSICPSFTRSSRTRLRPGLNIEMAKRHWVTMPHGVTSDCRHRWRQLKPGVDAGVKELRCAFDRIGLKPPQKYVGSHVLRHSLATGMLRKGASIDEIGDVRGIAPRRRAIKRYSLCR